MSKSFTFVFAALLAATSGLAFAQAPAAKTAAPAKSEAAASTDPIVQQRNEEREARKIYNQKVAAARKDRDARMKPAVDKAVQEAKAQGKDPLVAKRDAEKKAREASKAEYTSAVKAAAEERDASVAAARKKAGGKS
jgi:hypothetical protein